MKKKINSIVVLSLTLLMFACSPATQLTKSWADPSVTDGSFKPFTKVLVIAILKDETSQRLAEDRIATYFKPGVAVKSYSYFLPSDTNNKAIYAKLEKDGFDGMFIMRLTNVSQSLDIQQSGGYGYYGGYYGRGYYGAPYSSTTTVSYDNTFFVESSFYLLPTSKLIWSGTTSTLNPSNLNQTLDEILMAAKEDIIRRGIIKVEGEK